MLYPSYSDIDEGQSIAQHFLRLSCLISLSWIVVLRVKLAKPKHLFLMSSLLWLQERSLLISCLLLCCSWFYQRHTSVSLGPSSLNSSMGTHIGLPLTGLVTHFLHVALPPYLTWGYFQPAVTWYTKNINIFLHKLHKKYKICLFENSIFQSDKLHNIKPSKSPGIEVWGQKVRWGKFLKSLRSLPSQCITTHQKSWVSVTKICLSLQVQGVLKGFMHKFIIVI